MLTRLNEQLHGVWIFCLKMNITYITLLHSYKFDYGLKRTALELCDEDIHQIDIYSHEIGLGKTQGTARLLTHAL